MGVVFDITERKRAEKDFNAALVEIRGLKERLEEENLYLREEIFEVKGFDEIVGKSDALIRAHACGASRQNGRHRSVAGGDRGG